MQNDKDRDKERGFTIVDRRFAVKSEEEKQETLEAEKKGQKAAEKETAPPKPEKPKAQKEEFAPGITLSNLIFSLSHTALIQMGEIPNPASNRKEKDLASSKQSIDLIALLQEKTKGNQTKDEEMLFENVLYDLRMRFVQNSR
ncbi:MAG: DUF1844 domain-containing protein [Candidatus Schekmanbacteria bacterium]|nr:DUF1844 domain-containing protein [Candidatus Schekmanbacteria bacterium]